VLSWSNAKYKLTLGVGSIAIVGMLAELWKGVLSFWLVLPIALLPLVAFVFCHPSELPAWFVRIAHVGGSIWYMVVATGLLIVLATNDKPLPRGWPVYPLFVMIGAFPCGVVLYRAASGKYPPPEALDQANADPKAAAEGGRETGSL
jgi:hypothetical protein